MPRRLLFAALVLTTFSCGIPDIASEFTRGSTSSNGITGHSLEIECNPYRIADGGFALKGEIPPAHDRIAFNLTAISIRGPLPIGERMTASVTIEATPRLDHAFQIAIDNGDLSIMLGTDQSHLAPGTFLGTMSLTTDRFNHGPNDHEVSCIIKEQVTCPMP